MGPFAGFHENAEPMISVLRKHQAQAAKIDEDLVPPELLSSAQEAWDEAVELAEQYGVRNSQASGAGTDRLPGRRHAGVDWPRAGSAALARRSGRREVAGSGVPR